MSILQTVIVHLVITIKLVKLFDDRYMIVDMGKKRIQKNDK